MTIAKQHHFIAVPLSAWGHLRPTLHLVLNLLALHPSLHCSLLLPPSAAPRVQQELKSVSLAHLYSPQASGANTPTATPGSESASVIDRLQIIECSSLDPNRKIKEFSAETMAEEGADFVTSLPGFLRGLLGGKAALRAADEAEKGQENRFAHLIPSFAIFDAFHPEVPEVADSVCQSLAKPLIPLIAFCPCNASAAYHHFAAEENGGMLAKMIRLVEEDVAKGRNPAEAYGEYGFGSYGEVINLPGLNPKYDYEWYPLMGTMPPLGEAFMQVGAGLKAVHDPRTTALIAPFTAETEPEAWQACQAEFGKPVIMAGPQFPDNVWNGIKLTKGTAQVSADDERVLDFLDRMNAKYGAKSVCYVSLGSLFYPLLRPELVKYLLNSLHAAGIPLVFAHASAMAQTVPDGVTEGLIGHEDVCVIKFAPQWQVLNHEATGFFVTHCGSNSTSEAILAELPLVAMPFAADQGEFTALLTEKYRVGIDLKQVKTFKGGNDKWNKLYDGTVVVGTEEAIVQEMNEAWKRIKGPDGEQMRERMRRLKAILKKSWENGEARKAMEGVEKYF